MNDHLRNVLFLCTGNSARSIMAEAILNRRGAGRFRAYSAGSHPKGTVHATTLALLAQLGYPIGALRSKAWDEFAQSGAPVMDYIITVCDQAAGEVCPVWPGHPLTAHWGLPDPAAVDGSDAVKMTAFRRAYAILDARIGHFLGVDLPSLGPEDLKRALRDAGTIVPQATDA
jgi:arsenate reductase